MFAKNKENTPAERSGKMTGKHLAVLIICCLLAAATLGLQSNVAGVYYTPVSDDLGIGRGAFTMHMTILTLACAVVTLFIPSILKHIDYKKALIVAVLVNAAGTAAMGRFSSTTAFYILGAIRGIAMSFFFSVPITMIINNWFIKNHGVITSLAFSFSGLAGALFSPILSYLIVNIGWRFTYVLNGAMMILLALPALLVSWHLNPRDDELTPYGYGIASEGAAGAVPEREPVNASVFSLAFIALFIRAVFVAGITSVAQHFPGYVESVGLVAVSATILSAAMVGNILFKFVLGILSDMLGSFRAVFTMISITLVGLIIMFIVHDPKLMLIGAFLFGASYSVGSVGTPLLTRTFFGEENYNKIYPPIAFATNVGYSVIMVAIGYIYDYFGNYRIALGLSFVMIALIFAGIIIAKNTSPVTRAVSGDAPSKPRKMKKKAEKTEPENGPEDDSVEQTAAEEAHGKDAVSDVDVADAAAEKKDDGPSEEEIRAFEERLMNEDLTPKLELVFGENDGEKEEFTPEE
ncbi:MAG: MFS transporter [Oscillospiraceae bacterium]|nr:MFS transporter [Oscillospiraceae bacterium]